MGICDDLLDLIWSLLGRRFERVVLNGQTSEWLPVKAGVPQGSIWELLFFLICINDLSIDILSTVKLFADDTSIFSIIYNAKTTAYELNRDWQKIAEFAHQWKMSFNKTWISRLRKLFFHRKWLNHLIHKSFFNNIPVSCVRHLGIYLDEKLNFNHQIKEKKWQKQW